MHMKRTLCASFALSLLIIGLPFLQNDLDAPSDDPPPQAEYAETKRDTELTVRVLSDDGSVSEMSVRDYLIGVVSAEMPASFEPEALKAQTVAARSYLKYALEREPKHDSADICMSADCCQAYKTSDELRVLWGEKYDEYAEKIEEAAVSTDGEYLSCDGEAVLAVFHSSSYGKTESSSELWSDVPYLVSVSSPEDESSVPNYVSTAVFGDIDFRDTLLYLRPEADFTAPSDEWVGELTHTESGRVKSIVIGGVSFAGTEIRELFSLRSTAFELKHTDSGFEFTVTGYGHGVGMSQYGANAMAKDGSGYREILAHYYPDTTLIVPNSRPT